MSFYFNGTQSNVTISGGVSYPTPSSSQSIINAEFTMTGSVATAYTVTTGKKFALYGVIPEDTTAGVFIYKTDGSTKLAELRANGNGTWGQSQFIFPIPIWIYNSGEFVKINGTNTVKINIVGVEY